MPHAAMQPPLSQDPILHARWLVEDAAASLRGSNRVPTAAVINVCDRLRNLRNQLRMDQLDGFDRAIGRYTQHMAREFKIEMDLPYLLSLR